MTRALVPCLSLAFVSACAAVEAREVAEGPSAERAEHVSATAEAEPREASAAASPASTPTPAALAARADTDTLGQVELELWNSPDFRRRFTESYLAESDIEPKIAELEREGMQEVADKLAAGKLGDAQALLEKRRGPGTNAVLDFTLGNIHFQRDEFEEAVASYQTAVQKFPRYRRAWENMGLCHARLNHFAEAAQAFTRVLEFGGGSAATYGLLGIAHAKLGSPLAAESAFRMAALLDPGSNDWKMGMAESLFKEERFADAAALCGTLIEAQPERFELWLLQANAFARLQRPLDAAQNLELVDRLGKSTADSLYLLGDIYTNEELFDLATKSYLAAMEKDAGKRPERAIRAARGLAVRGAHVETARLVEDIESRYAEALDDAQRRDLLHLRVRVAVAQGAGEEEVRALEEIVALDPLDGEALLLLGQHEKDAGNLEKADFYYERAAQLEAFEPDAKVRQAQLLVGQGKYAEALPLLRRAQTLKPRENVQQFLEQIEKISQSRPSS